MPLKLTLRHLLPTILIFMMVSLVFILSPNQPVSAAVCPPVQGNLVCEGTDTVCGGVCRQEPVCPGGQPLNCNSCTCTSSGYVPVYLDYSPVPQPGSTSISGNGLFGGNLEVTGSIDTTNDFYMTSGKAIRVDGSGATVLNFGNWGTGAAGLNTSFWGNVGIGTNDFTSDPHALMVVSPGQALYAAGGSYGGYFKDTTDGAEAWVGEGTYGVYAKGKTIGGGFRNLTYPTVAVQLADNKKGLYARSDMTCAFLSTSDTQCVAIDGYSPLGIGVRGQSNNNWAGYFLGGKGVYVETNVNIGGDKDNASEKLQISSLNRSVIFQSGNTTNNWVGTVLADTEYNEKWFIGINGSQNDLIFQRNGDLLKRDLVINNANGNVGIGTTVPGAKLQINPLASTEGLKIVLPATTPFSPINIQNSAGSDLFRVDQNGQVKIADGTQGAGKVLTSDVAGLASWQMPSSGVGGSGTLNYVSKFTPNGTTLGNSQIFDNGTNVGIGTTVPGALLEVKGVGTGKIYIGQWAANNTYAGIGLAGSLSSGNYNLLSSPSDTNLFINRPTGKNIQFRENNVTQMIIASGGNLGIGVNNPGAKLQINPPASTEGLRIISASNWSPLNIRNNANTLDLFRVDQNGQVKIVDGTQGAGKVLTSDASGFASWQIPSSGAWTRTAPDGPVFLTTPTDNVGIGVTPLSPAMARLELAPRNDAGGNPDDPTLLLRGSANDLRINLDNTNAAGGVNWRIDSTAGASGYGQGNLVIVKETGGGYSPAFVTVNSSGNVAIGSLGAYSGYTPQSKLEIIDSGSDKALRISDSTSVNSKRLELGYNSFSNYGRIQVWDGETGSAGDLVLQIDGGNVGIGKVPAANKLDVNGDVNITGKLKMDIQYKTCNPIDLVTGCSCPSGYIVLSGGASCGGSNILNESSPTSYSLSTWSAVCLTDTGTAVPAAVIRIWCMKVEDNTP